MLAAMIVVCNSNCFWFLLATSTTTHVCMWDVWQQTGWETSARPLANASENMAGRVVKQAWASGILYRLYKTLPSSGECQKFLVSQPSKVIGRILLQGTCRIFSIVCISHIINPIVDFCHPMKHLTHHKLYVLLKDEINQSLFKEILFIGLRNKTIQWRYIFMRHTILFAAFSHIFEWQSQFWSVLAEWGLGKTHFLETQSLVGSIFLRHHISQRSVSCLNHIGSGLTHWGRVTHISLVQTMAWHLVGAKPLSEPVLEYC